ncbi:unnamed protein product, partial [Brenthis ino]
MVYTIPETTTELQVGSKKDYTYIINWKPCHERGRELVMGEVKYTDDLMLSTILSFLGPFTTQCILGARNATVPSEIKDRPQEEKDQGVLALVLTSLMTLAKPVTLMNSAAYQKRWSTALDTLSIQDLVAMGSWTGVVKTATRFQGIIAVRSDLRQEIVDRVLTMTDETGIKGAIIAQLRMVWSYASLKAAEFMEKFSKTPCRALEIPSVLDQALLLKQRWEAAERENPNFPYSRVRNPNAHPELNHAHFPDLYYAAIAYAKANKLIGENFHVSQPNKVQNALLIDRYITKMAVAAMGEITEETRQKLMTLGYPVGHWRSHDTDSEEEEERTHKKRPRRH